MVFPSSSTSKFFMTSMSILLRECSRSAWVRTRKSEFLNLLVLAKRGMEYNRTTYTRQRFASEEEKGMC